MSKAKTTQKQTVAVSKTAFTAIEAAVKAKVDITVTNQKNSVIVKAPKAPTKATTALKNQIADLEDKVVILEAAAKTEAQNAESRLAKETTLVAELQEDVLYNVKVATDAEKASELLKAKLEVFEGMGFFARLCFLFTGSVKAED